MDRENRRDPRREIIKERLGGIKKIIAVASGKGGVGKSCVASLLSLALKEKNVKLGLLDLDIWSPSTHLILGIKNLSFKEDKGIIPPTIEGIRYLSITFYESLRALPLRGKETSEVITELLSITRWEDTKYLIIDMPPGISDPLLDILRYIPDSRFIIVTTPSLLAFETVKKLITLLREQKIKIEGIIENMVYGNSIKEEIEKSGVRVLTSVSYEKDFEKSLGSLKSLRNTRFYKKIKNLRLL